jgi:hypothetical protein
LKAFTLGRYTEGGEKVIKNLTEQIEEKWLQIAICTGLGLSFISIIQAAVLGGKPLDIDSAFFLHSGWLFTQGYYPYLHIWDIKPPLAYLIPAVYNFATLGNTYAVYWLSIVINSILITASSVLAGKLFLEIKEDELAALGISFAVLSINGLTALGSWGYRPKFFVMFFGLLSIWLYLKNRELYAGISGGIAALFWHFGAIFPLTIGLLLLKDRDFRGFGKAVIGGITISIVSLIPIIAVGGFKPMVEQIFIAPLQISEPLNLLRRLGKGVVGLKYSAITLFLGLSGLIYSLKDSNRMNYLWIYIPAVWFGLQIFLVDFDGFADLFLGMTFISIGCGFVINRLEREEIKYILVSSLLLIAVIGSIFNGGMGVIYSSTFNNPSGEQPALRGFLLNLQSEVGENQTDQNSSETGSSIRYSTQERFWNKIRPSSCHIRMSGLEKKWIQSTSAEIHEKECKVASDILK